MTLAQALAIVVGRTRHERYRELCDPAHPDYEPAYIPIVFGMAGAQSDPSDEIFARAEAARLAYEALPSSERRGCCPGGT
jgi:hypothetical protein